MRYLTSNSLLRQASRGVGDDQPVVRKRRAAPSVNRSLTASTSHNSRLRQPPQEPPDVEWVPPPVNLPTEVPRFSDESTVVSAITAASVFSFPEDQVPLNRPEPEADTDMNPPAVESTSHSSNEDDSKTDFVENTRNQIAVLQSLLLLQGGCDDSGVLAKAANGLRESQATLESHVETCIMQPQDVQEGFLEELLTLNGLLVEAISKADDLLAAWLSETPDKSASAAPPKPEVKLLHPRSPGAQHQRRHTVMQSIAEDATTATSDCESVQDVYSTAVLNDSDDEEPAEYHRTSLDQNLLAEQGDINGLLCMLRAQQPEKRLGAAEALLRFAKGGEDYDSDMGLYWQKQILSCGGLESLLDARGSARFKTVTAQTIAYCLSSFQFSFGRESNIHLGSRILRYLQSLAALDSASNATAASGMVSFWFQFLEPLLQSEIAQGSLKVEADEHLHFIPLDQLRNTNSSDSSNSIRTANTVKRTRKVQKFLERFVLLMIQIGHQSEEQLSDGQGHTWGDTIQELLELSRRVSVEHDVRFALNQIETLLEPKKISHVTARIPSRPPPLAWTISEVESHDWNASASYSQLEANGRPHMAPSFAPVSKTFCTRISHVTVHPVKGKAVVVGEIITVDRKKAYWLGATIKDCIFGRVYQGTIVVATTDGWKATEERVAIKVISKLQLRDRQDFLENPETEFAAMQHVSFEAQRQKNVSETIIATRDLWQDEDYIYLTMPYCETSLFEVVKGSGRLDEKTARYYFRQILQGILHMQRSGVCHRDLSLENILLHHDTAVIIDFGIALRVPLERRRLRQLIQPTEPCGKPYYMAPEIRNNQVFDGFAVDLWAAAVVLFILLVGNPPWDHPGNNMRYELIAKQDQLACLLNSWDRSVSQDAADLLQSMLREDPHERLSLKQILEHPWILADDVAA